MEERLTEQQQTMVEENIALVIAEVKKFKPKYNIYEDLKQEGCIGLCRAVLRFDITKNCEFSTFAVPYIRYAILDYLNKGELVKTRMIKGVITKVKTIELLDDFLYSDSQIDSIELMDEIKSLVSEKDLSVLKLIYEGYTPKEIYVILNITPGQYGTIRRRIKESLLKLKEKGDT